MVHLTIMLSYFLVHRYETDAAGKSESKQTENQLFNWKSSPNRIEYASSVVVHS